MRESTQNPPQSKKPELLWKETVIYDKPPGMCSHYFEFISGTSVECRNCKLGLIGVYDLKDGKPVI